MGDARNSHKDTQCVHAGVEPDRTTGAIMTPIYQTSTFVQRSPGDHKGYEYARTLNPTREALENSIAILENATFGACFGSGLAAADAILKMFKPGDEILFGNDLYGGTYRLMTRVFAGFGLKAKFINMHDLEAVEKHLSDSTKMIMMETPTNPTLGISDIKGLSKIARKHHCILCVDNTFASPALQNPIDLGADIVWHSATKYLGGHSDVVLGAAVTNDPVIGEQLHFMQNASGAVPGPMDCFLVLRGIKTLHLRMERASENAMKVAQYLHKHAAVDNLYYPGLASHPNHEVAKKQMKQFGGMLSFDLKDNSFDKAKTILEKTKVFTLAESLGGVESLIGHPASMTHASIPKEEREKTGVTDSLIRLSVGIEHIDDLVADLDQALG
ncbi:MAG TPA: cystathionine gamma-synthase [Saprospiraceae bacterium]|nr:cystathionine gamma-synthase [Saprospiraceae bacterium]